MKTGVVMEPLTIETFQPSLKEERGPLGQRGELSQPRPVPWLVNHCSCFFIHQLVGDLNFFFT